jgi:hypothetical protein
MCEREWEVFLKLEMEFGSCSSFMGREVGVSIYRWGFKTSCLSQNPAVEPPPRVVEPPLACQADCLPVWLSDWLADWPAVWLGWPNQLNHPIGAVEPPLTSLATYLPVWLADCWSEVRGVKDQLKCPSKPVQLVLTRDFRRENPSSTARRQVQLVYGQRGSQLKLKFSWSWESSTVVEKAQLSWSSAQLKSSATVEEAQLSWSSAQLKLKKFSCFSTRTL